MISLCADQQQSILNRWQAQLKPFRRRVLIITVPQGMIGMGEMGGSWGSVVLSGRLVLSNWIAHCRSFQMLSCYIIDNMHTEGAIPYERTPKVPFNLNRCVVQVCRSVTNFGGCLV